MKTIFHAVRLFFVLRLSTVLAIGLVVYIPVLFTTRSQFRAIVSSFPFLAGALGGFALNDYYDAEPDSVNRPTRAIPSGLLGRRTVLNIAIVSLLLATISIAFVSESLYQAMIYTSGLIGVLTYNWIAATFAFLKNIWTGLLVSLPIFFIVNTLTIDLYTLPIGYLALVTGREVLMDIVDVAGDSRSGLLTVPILYGERAASRLGISLLLFGTLIILANLYEPQQSHWLMVIHGANILTPIIIAFRWERSRPSEQRAMIRILWIPLLTTTILLIV